MRVLAKKCGKPDGEKKTFEKHKQRPYENGVCQRDFKKWSRMVDSYRPWQDPIGQGQWEWNGYREKLYSLAMRLKNGHRNLPKNLKNVISRRNWFEVRANEKIQE